MVSDGSYILTQANNAQLNFDQFQRICSDEMPKLGTVQLLLLLLALPKKATQDWKGEYSPDNFPKTGRWEGCLL